MDIEYEVMSAECDVVLALGECYIKECLMELNGCGASIFTESDKPKKSLKERFLGWIEKIKSILKTIGQFLSRKWHKFTNRFKKGDMVIVNRDLADNLRFGGFDLVKVQREKFPHIVFTKHFDDDEGFHFDECDVMINESVLKVLNQLAHPTNPIYDPIDDLFEMLDKKIFREVEYLSNISSIKINVTDSDIDKARMDAKNRCNSIIEDLNKLDISSTENLKKSSKIYLKFFDNKESPISWLVNSANSIKNIKAEVFDEPLVKKAYQSYLEISSLYIKIRKLHSQKVDELFTMCDKELFELRKYIGKISKFKKFKPEERENSKYWKNRSDQYDVDEVRGVI